MNIERGRPREQPVIKKYAARFQSTKEPDKAFKYLSRIVRHLVTLINANTRPGSNWIFKDGRNRPRFDFLKINGPLKQSYCINDFGIY